MLRIALLAVVCASVTAFAPASSALPSLRRAGAQCSSIMMKSEEDASADSLPTRRMVVGGLFAMLAPLAGMPQSAEAGRSGARVGGGGFGAKPGGTAPARVKVVRPPPSVTVIQQPPPSVTIIQAAPSMPYGYGGYGGGMMGGGYGFGLSPGQFLGLSAIELAESIARENRRRAQLEEQFKIQQQLGKDQAQIDMLQKQLAETNAKVAAMSDAQKQQTK